MIDFKGILGYIAHVLVEALFPTKCPVCDVFFPPPEPGGPEEDIREITYSKAMASCLCPDCVTDFRPIESPICTQCGTPFNGGGDRICNTCLTTPKRFRKARAFGVYAKDQAFGVALRRFKYNEKVKLARPFEKLLFSLFVQCWDKDDIDLVMPVPLHVGRSRERGFNQAYLLIRHWPLIAEKWDIPFSGIRIERDIIFKTKATKPQASLKDEQRQKNVIGVFSLKNSERIKGKRILLVDDVYTTGATVNECTKELLKGGAEYVDILTLAKRI